MKQFFGANAETKRNGVNTKGLRVIIIDNDNGNELMDENVGSILFSALTESDIEENGFTAGMAGQFSQISIIQSLEAVLDTAVEGLKESVDFDSKDYLELMAEIIKRGMERNFSKQEQMMAMLHGMAQILEKHSK